MVGAREHNLRDVTVELPRDSLVVITGLSGSGKSSLAFDTLYAEGQRRYVESLSAYARQFLGQMDKPDVDHIDGLSPAISIDQKTTSRNPRSTVATVTEAYDYLRLLFARIGDPHCHICGRPIAGQSVQQIADHVMELAEGTRFLVLAPLVRDRKGEHRDVFDHIRGEGFTRVAVDGEVTTIDEVPKLNRNMRHTIEVVVDRLVMREDLRRRLTESLETALQLGEGLVRIQEHGGEGREWTYSESFACPEHGAGLDELAPRVFSFNAPHGACPTCTGLGFMPEVDPELLIDPNRTLADGAIIPWADRTTDYYELLLQAIAEEYEIDLDVPWRELPAEQRELLTNGPVNGRRQRMYLGKRKQGRNPVGWFEGVVPQLRRQHTSSMSQAVRDSVEQYMSLRPCPACGGARLRPEVLAVTIGGLNIYELCQLSVERALEFLETLDLNQTKQMIGDRVVREVSARLRFLVDVGVGYLNLERAAGTLSGGEAQRIRLATQIGSGLMGVLYILDEPSIGLHQRDNRKLIGTLERLRDQGNTVIVVEHDEDMMRSADHLVDMGPGAGEHGGRVVAQGTPAEVQASEESVTGAYLSGARAIPVPERRREGRGWLRVVGAAEHNLRGIDVEIPVGTFACVTGVSGSGKSTLVNDIILRALAGRLSRRPKWAGRHELIEGLEHFDKVIAIDQSPIGRTPRSNPATYTGIFDHIRQLFSKTPDARARGYNPGRFSFNVKGGRCEHCKGDGTITIEMHFLPDVYVPCEVCGGRRYNSETLSVRYGGRNISDVLDLPIDEALEAFSAVPRIHRRLQTLVDVGLGYVRLGQPATTLSGGEAQRVKLASELSRVATGRTLYVLDEPTTGLHMADIERLLVVLQRLVDSGNTVLVIEHNLDVIKCADWLVDLGPEGGAGGGDLIVAGTPEAVAVHEASFTGAHLRELLPAATATG
ncbi:MAG: excinuclease ABC subunit UvrA [Actinobacteria bacterium]|nr:excinuclease ABC subunit UvrA [Thermoleophilia bacterium]MCB9012115.1 excinuclease ABC subunit UvrA [Actinomycetota bacterium]